ncbi:MAG: helix-turn-helix transcriptional regulator [Microthrixaceae bacterium]
MTDLQIQARALGDPTRHKIFRHVAEARGPIGVADLTAEFGLNHNAIRQHLTKLVEADLLTESTARPEGRGRPKLQYRLNPNAESRWGVTGPYERLSMLLAEVVRTGDTPEEVGRRAGSRHRTDDQRTETPLDDFVRAMAEEGFEPVVSDSDASIDVRLDACPFSSAAQTDPDTVCELHLGLARGVAEAVGGIEVVELVTNDPREAHCHLRCCAVGDTAGTPTS